LYFDFGNSVDNIDTPPPLKSKLSQNDKVITFFSPTEVALVDVNDNIPKKIGG